MRTLIIDNYDSFTFNLYQALAAIHGEPPMVVRNDQLSVARIRELDVDGIVISPGPGRPDVRGDFGVCADVLREIDLPILGVCLGCQGLGVAYGATVTRAPEPMHGRVSTIRHDDPELFAGIPQHFTAVRYHSLVVVAPLPDCLQRIAWTDDGLIMGLRHREKPIWGVQFHPESIGTEFGSALLKNFCRICERQRGVPAPGRAPFPPEGVSVVPRGLASARKPSSGGVFARAIPLTSSPEDIFHALFGDAPYAFWLDRPSASGHGWAFMGAVAEAERVWRYDVAAASMTTATGGAVTAPAGDFFDVLKAALAAGSCATAALPFDFQGGAVGYLGYELKAECGGQARHRSPHPDAMLMWVDRFLAIDCARGEIHLVCRGDANGRDAAETWFTEMTTRLGTVMPVPALTLASAPTSVVRPGRSAPDYLEDVQACLQYLADGESYEICLTNTLHVDAQVDPLRLHRRLRQVNPAPFASFLRFGELAVVSASPEQFLRITAEGMVETRPIKGTARRDAVPEEDAALRVRLGASEKTRAENLMIVDLMRNDLGVVCEPGSVHVPRMMEVETYATVHQLVSTVRGKLRADVHAVDCVRHAFPAGSMTGAPKRRTLEILDALEVEARGIYSGAIGYFGWDGSADLSVVIRTAVVTPGHVTVGTGGAVVALSRPADEHAEMELKAQAILRAIGEARV